MIFLPLKQTLEGFLFAQGLIGSSSKLTFENYHKNKLF